MISYTSRLAGLLLLGLFTLPACNGGKAAREKDTNAASGRTALIGKFNADSAYSYVAAQVGFGPRVPGTPAHLACRDYLVAKLSEFQPDTLIVQEGKVTAFNGDVLPISNIMASYNKEARRRVLLIAHWDTRPWADMCTTSEKRKQPVPGANDGGSGIGVLLEIARNLGEKAPGAGVDILLVDAEDYGDASSFAGNEESWCLGTQYWIANQTFYTNRNMPVYGILLDMVGGTDARFHYENYSLENARTPTLRIWSEAARLGHGDIFVERIGGTVTDDHIFLTRSGIPTTDIIELNNAETQSFPPTWHTLRDNMSNISRRTLQVVGETVLNVIYKEPTD